VQVLRSVAAGVPAAEVFRMALGDADGEAELNLMSSSLLPPDPSALPHYPQHDVRQRLRVPVRRLDAVLAGRALPDDLFIAREDRREPQDRGVDQTIGNIGLSRFAAGLTSPYPLLSAHLGFHDDLICGLDTLRCTRLE
jgi:hypothetical protein